MRILRIAGCNLASLSEAFELDLERGPLGQAGLFAITGPTGSGKTSLLDTLCLALFDNTPRLAQAGRVKIGLANQDDRNRLTAQDTKSLLRHDAGSGFAEVDFLGVDGGRYRARWSVRRAGDKASGRIQNVALSLQDLSTGQQLGDDKKTVTLERIEQRLGLNFEQFTRSVLLAQGQFASFLRAKSKTRASLLERMTGTDLFARISIAAYERAKASEQALQDLESEQERLGLLPADQLQDLQQQVTALNAEIQTAETLLHAVQAHSLWQQEALRHKERVESAERAQRDAAQKWERAATERAQQALFDSHQHLAPELSSLKQAQASATALQGDQTRHKLKLEALEREVSTQRTQQQELTDGLERHRAHAAELLPRLEQAQRLQEQLQRHRDQHQKLQDRAQQAQTDLTQVTSSMERLERERAESRTLAVGAQAQLNADPLLSRLLSDWPQLQPLLAEHARLHEALSDGAGLQQALTHATSTHAAASDDLSAARTKQQRAQAARDQARAARIPFPEQEEEALKKEQTRLNGAIVLHQRATQSAEHLVELQTANEDRLSQIQNTQQALETAERLLERTTGERDASAHAVKQLERSLDLEARRHELVPDEPCPLCGSTEHPFAENAPVHEALRDLQETLRQAELKLQAQQQQVNDTASDLSTQRKLLAQEQKTLQAAQTQDQSLRDQLQALIEQTPAAADPQTWEADLSARLGTLEQLKAKARSSQARLETLQSELEAAQRQTQQAQAHADKAALDLERARAQAQDAQDTRAQLDSIKRQLLRAMEGFPGSWRARLEADPGPQLQEWEAQLPELRAAADRLESAEEHLRTSEPEHAALKERLAGRQQAQQEALQALAEAAEELKRLHDRFDALGVPGPAQAQDQLKAKEAQLTGELTEHQRTLASTREDLSAARAKQSSLHEQLADLQEQSQRHQASLASALEHSPLDLPGLTQLLGEPQESQSARKQRLATLDSSLRAAEQTLAERKSRQTEHLGEAPPAPECDQDAVQSGLGQQRQQLAQLQLQLRTHAEATERSEQLQTALRERRKEHKIWAQLKATIGSADGNAFREFAQGLTLETLLQHANTHLGDLAPRYRLARVPGQDLDLQILDQALAGEPRSVATLSGGESFLVSLALALGLASLSGSKTPVGTLFIDEGFGSLDPKSLDTALATLEALQAGGRQVGIISHVAGIGDHIGVQVQVLPLAPGRSHVVLPS